MRLDIGIGTGITIFACLAVLIAVTGSSAKANTIDDLVAQVSQDMITMHIQALEAIGPRNTPMAQVQASTYIANQLNAYGYNGMHQPVRLSEM